MGQKSSIYFNVQVPGARTKHFVYVTRGKNVAVTRPGAEPQTTCRYKMPMCLLGFKREKKPEKNRKEIDPRIFVGLEIIVHLLRFQ